MEHFAECMNAAALAVAAFPNPSYSQPEAIDEFDIMMKLLHHVREMRGELQIPPSDAVTVFIENPSSVVIENTPMLEALTKIEKIIFEKAPSGSICATKSWGEVTTSVLLPAHLISKEIERLEKDLLKTQKEIEGLKQKLSVQDFIDKAPKEVVAKLEDQLSKHLKSEDTIQQKLVQFKSSSS